MYSHLYQTRSIWPGYTTITDNIWNNNKETQGQIFTYKTNVQVYIKHMVGSRGANRESETRPQTFTSGYSCFGKNFGHPSSLMASRGGLPLEKPLRSSEVRTAL